MTTTKAVPTSNEDFRGYIPDLLEKLAEQPGCDCRFNLRLVADGKYGAWDDESGWNGMIGEVVSGVRVATVLITAFIVHDLIRDCGPPLPSVTSL